MRVIRGADQRAPGPPRHVLPAFRPQADEEFMPRWCAPLYWHLVYLAEHGQAMPPLREIAGALGWTKPTVVMALKELRFAGAIRVTAQSRGSGARTQIDTDI